MFRLADFLTAFSTSPGLMVSRAATKYGTHAYGSGVYGGVGTGGLLSIIWLVGGIILITISIGIFYSIIRKRHGGQPAAPTTTEPIWQGIPSAAFAHQHDPELDEDEDAEPPYRLQ